MTKKHQINTNNISMHITNKAKPNNNSNKSLISSTGHTLVSTGIDANITLIGGIANYIYG